MWDTKVSVNDVTGRFTGEYRDVSGLDTDDFDGYGFRGAFGVWYKARGYGVEVYVYF
jgi:hypothetical protein